MGLLQKSFNKAARTVTGIFMGHGLAQAENVVKSTGGYRTPGLSELCREVGAEGIVLLKNDKNVLPLDKNTKTAVFGRCQMDLFHVGYGSGGNVYPPYQTELMEALRESGLTLDEELADTYFLWCQDEKNRVDHGFWGSWPMNYPEMPLTEETVRACAARDDTAVIIIGRAAGEDRECQLKKGSYYLTDTEKENISLITKHFEKTVLLINAGNLMDLVFTEQYDFSAILYAWQLGMEDGHALADVLGGRISPSGHLPDTIARHWKDYPSSANFGGREHNYYREGIFVGYRYFVSGHDDKVLWPFGFGLSYTDFSVEPQGMPSLEAEKSAFGEDKSSSAYFINTVNQGNFECVIPTAFTVTNVGSYPGKAVVQVYVRPPKGRLIKPDHVLAGYAKTTCLEAGESEDLRIDIRPEDFASYDERGLTGETSAYVLEPGSYEILYGRNARDLTCAGIIEVPELVVLRRCEKALAHTSKELKALILRNLPEELPYTGYKGFSFEKVLSGECDMDTFLAQLTDRELTDLTRGGGGMGSPLGTEGNAGALGGITEDLRKRGIPALITADGPAGIRVTRNAALLPCGTAIASTWNLPLVEQLFAKEGEEARHFGVDILLSPGMNIHRNPLCGRNFEYYSEDPYLSGRTAAAAVRGIQSAGISACPKHFAGNNQEYKRNTNDSRIGERALREIYLRNFEICVREGNPLTIMTSYNKVNGIWSHYNYDLAETLLRREWGYEGLVITDWFMKKSASPEFPALRDNAYRVRSGVDVLMPGTLNVMQQKYIFDETLLSSVRTEQDRKTEPSDKLTRGEVQRCARHVLELILAMKGNRKHE